MEQYAVLGGTPLVGEVEIGGAKNAALAILAAAILTDEPVIIDNVPDISDIHIMMEALESIGVSINRKNRHCLKINSAGVNSNVVNDENSKRIRGIYYFLGSLLGRFHHAEVVLPGGCDIGSRPIDQHIKGFRALGANVKIEYGLVITDAESLEGGHIYLDKPSVGATINIMLVAVLASGQTIIENAAKEPHVVDVANFLSSMGAVIRGAGTDTIRITGVERLHGTEYTIIPDQIEAGTFMFAAAVTRGDVTVKNVIPKHLESISSKLLEIGCEIEESDDAIRVVASKPLTATQVKTLPYPGFPTDMQAQITVALGLSSGTSIVTESIFENRFKYVDELTRMGAEIKVEGTAAIIIGVNKYTGADLTAPDLRAGAALVLAALAAEGFSTIDGIKYIERGYENFIPKLQNLGAKIDVVDGERELKKFKLRVG